MILFLITVNRLRHKNSNSIRNDIKLFNYYNRNYQICSKNVFFYMSFAIVAHTSLALVNRFSVSLVLLNRII